MKTLFSCLLLLLAIFISGTTYAQKKAFNGRVIDEKTNMPLEFVSVYITNTTIGTTTDEKGSFSLMLDPGKYELVVFMVGYGPIVHSIEIKRQDSVIASPLFKIAQQAYTPARDSILDEHYSPRYSNLKLFKENFFGKSIAAEKCKLLNPEVLKIIFDEERQILTITAREALKIENAELGYKINYLLISFVMNKEENYSNYLGYPHFELMQGNERQKQEWAENRLKAFQGSLMHFVRSLRNQKLVQEGFLLTRPKEGVGVYPAEVSTNGLPVFVKMTVYEEMSYNDFLSYPGNRAKLKFKGSLRVVYIKEMEDFEYVYSISNSVTKKVSYQTSFISLTDPFIFLQENGSFDKPFAFKFQGYWSCDKVGDMLPFDYYP